MSKHTPTPPLRPHTPASVARPGAIRPSVNRRPAPGRAQPRAKGAAPQTPSTEKVRTRRPRSNGPTSKGGHSQPKVRAQPAASTSFRARAQAPQAAIPAERALAPQAPERALSLADQLCSPAYVAKFDPAADLAVEPNKTCFFDTINQVKAMTVAGPNPLCVDENLARARGYEPEDLLAIAEIAWHYLMSGGLKLALTLYEGLAAISPEDPYFALALGLVHDRMNEPQRAHVEYERAARLDPSDGRPDVNRAELFLEAGDKGRAMKLLGRAYTKAERRGDEALARKASALLGHLSRRRLPAA